jgi:photosystem II stability/assembly factor-like uncharacterized protein
VFLAALAALALPLLRRPTGGDVRSGQSAAGATAVEPTDGLVEEREATLVALRELDFDYATGKLAESDYHALRSGYERRALALLKATDSAAAGSHAAPPTPHRNGVVAHVPETAHRNGAAAAADRVSQGVGSSRRGRRAALLTSALGLLFVAGVAGVYVVGNRSQSDQRPVATLEGVGPRALALSPAEPRRAFLAAAAGLLTSGDGGASWQPVPSLDRALRAVAASPARPTRVYAAGPEALAVSDDGGRNWTTLPVALPEGGTRAGGSADVRALAVDPADADHMRVVVEGAGLFRSDDGGHSWTRTAADVPANATALDAVGAGASPADRAGGGVVLYLASATDGVLASADEGRSWAPASGALNGALPTLRVSSLVFDAESGDTATLPDGRTVRGTLYAGTEQGVFRSVDRGQSWARLSLAVPVAAVAAGGDAGAGVLLAADREGAIYRSQNRGVTWDGS